MEPHVLSSFGLEINFKRFAAKLLFKYKRFTRVIRHFEDNNIQ